MDACMDALIPVGMVVPGWSINRSGGCIDGVHWYATVKIDSGCARVASNDLVTPAVPRRTIDLH